MNTSTHVLLGIALFGKPQRAWITGWAALGGLTPDVPAIVMVGWARWVDGKPAREIFGTLYFSEPWQAIMAPMHSFPIWGAVLALGIVMQWRALIAFAAAGSLHLVCDFLLHVDDAHRQFWPLSDWRFHSRVSYWDAAHYGRIVRPIELVVAIGCAGWLAIQHTGLLARLGFGGVLLLYLAQSIYFAMIFG